MAEKSVYCCRRDDRDVTSALQLGPRRMLLLSVPDWMRPHDLLSPSSWWKEQTGFCRLKKKKGGGGWDLRVDCYGTFLQTSSLQRGLQQPRSCKTLNPFIGRHWRHPFDFVFSSVRHIVSLSSMSSSLLSSSWALFWSLFHSPPQLLSSVCICAFTTVSWHMELWPPQGTSYRLIWVSFVQFNSLKPSPVDVRWGIPIMKRDGVEPIHVSVVHRCYAYGSNNSMYNNEGEMHQCSLGI